MRRQNDGWEKYPVMRTKDRGSLSCLKVESWWNCVAAEGTKDRKKPFYTGFWVDTVLRRVKRYLRGIEEYCQM